MTSRDLTKAEKIMPMGKFGFRVRAQNGAIIERVLIQAQSEEDARARLLRLYPRSEMLSNWLEGGGTPQSHMSFEDIADLLND